VCSNGLIIEVPNKEGLGGYYRITHVGYNADKVVEAARGIAEALPKAFEQRERFKCIRLSIDQQLNYASEAAELRFERRHEVNLLDLLYARHARQEEPTLWNTFQRVQEAVIRGGVGMLRKDGSRIRSRALTSIREDVRLNRALWELTERTATLVQ